MARMNGVETDNFVETIEKAKRDPLTAVLNIGIDGEWTFQNPQFKATVRDPAGKPLAELVTDEPPFLGGAGLAPSPLHYCVTALAGCFCAGFAKWAAMEGVEIRGLKLKASAGYNMTKCYGLGEEKVIVSARLDVEVDSDASDETLDKIAKLADERCPAMSCWRNTVDVEINLTRKKHFL